MKLEPLLLAAALASVPLARRLAALLLAALAQAVAAIRAVGMSAARVLRVPAWQEPRAPAACATRAIA
jgi:hypothetical protein